MILLLLMITFPSWGQLIDSKGTIISTRFRVPAGCVRTSTTPYGNYLRSLPLKKQGSPVRHYDGSVKGNKVHAAVVDLPIGKRNLHQCADAVMRLRAEYLWRNDLHDQIHFNFTNGFKADYISWKKGKRIVVKKNQVKWVNTGKPSDTYDGFWKYMEMVFSYAGSWSLSKELLPVSIKEMRIGDVFIRGGHPGHAAVVVDMAIDTSTQEKIFLLAQSYMPAQETHVLINPSSSQKSAWYPLNFGSTLLTPEYRFTNQELMRFAEP